MQVLRKSITLSARNKNIIRCANRLACPMLDQKKNAKSFYDIPGPASLPFLGPIHNFLPGGKLAGYKGVKLSERLYKLYGPIVRLNAILGGYNTVFLFDPDAIEHVLRSEEPTPARPSMETLEYYRNRYNKTYDPKRIVGLNDHGERWREFRTKVNPIMMHPQTIKKYENVLEEISNDMVARLKTLRDENHKITKKLDVEMNLWALESIGVVALGTRLNCFDPNLPADSPVRKLIQNTHDIFSISDKLDVNPSFWRLFSTPNFYKAMNFYEEHDKLTKYFIDQAIEKIEATKRNSEKTPSEKPILEKLLEIDVETARVMASDMLMAGIATASNTVLATLYLIATNPEKQKKLREEVLSKQMRKPYLLACIKESRRMLPVVIGNVRLVKKQYNLLGYHIPKNTLVLFLHQYMSRMSEHYPRPDEFLPERWLTDKEDPLHYSHTHPFVTATFGFGVRMCVGRRIAQLETEIILSKIIENFELDWPSDDPLHIIPTSLNYITEPFNFVFKDL
ncbi:cytochrome P450 CYP12A2-like [Leguminivora glycinivorella]|uniref:cytochrome P450 CYP12A2-like n=1 Tax=Leguminivora glycinivorella TaxID=1035111 RepID=UPI00200E2F9E|nr:cytochrome P450 CYP12A2-like [Leguminivora glycinivorella]